MMLESRYNKIINTICTMNDISHEELFKILKDKECKYLMFLLMKKYNCINLNKLNEDFHIKNKRSITYGTKKAEEKFLINRDFRTRYFEAENIIDNFKNKDEIV